MVISSVWRTQYIMCVRVGVFLRVSYAAYIMHYHVNLFMLDRVSFYRCLLSMAILDGVADN